MAMSYAPSAVGGTCGCSKTLGKHNPKHVMLNDIMESLEGPFCTALCVVPPPKNSAKNIKFLHIYKVAGLSTQS